ncbi:MAG: VCBS repeat-containing protein [Bacteroidia bacterium]|nr:VCBS repeat-containing protein [Bacteroidia bacterium]
MKLRNCIIFTCFVFLYTCNLYSQNFTGVSFDLQNESGGTTKDYKARDYIRLGNGFHYKAENGKTFRGRIDEGMVFPVDYISSTELIDPEIRNLNTSLPVGKIIGNANVTQTGAAIYQIPIFTPLGTGNIQPQISITYNSLAGNGLLGMGWDIAGLSAITRIPQDFYHDNSLTGVSLNNSDRFALDGNRLIAITGTYGDENTTYRTESEIFSVINSQNPIGTGPEHFIVNTKDGMTIEYGNTSDSKVIIPGSTEVLVWRINKITDLNGNYMTFTYSNSNGESCIEKINYTGNNGLSPYNAFEFYYSQRTDQNVNYIAGHAIPQTKILRAISVFCFGNLVRRYDFDYTFNVYSHLIGVTEKASDGSQLNSTIFKWGNMPSQTLTYSDISIPYYDYTNHVPNIVLTGDFNGDGIQELLVADRVRSIYGLFGWRIYKPYGNGHFSLLLHGTQRGYPEKTRVGDFNGDGLTDILFNYDFSPTFEYRVYSLDIVNTELALLYSVSASSSSVPYIGDFNGDGVSDLILKKSTGNNLQLYLSYYSSSGNWYFEDSFHGNISWGETDKIKIIDFNGDGKTDLITVNYNSTIYSFTKNPDGSYTMNTLYNSGFPTKWHSIKYGDFNGDGKTDVLTFVNNQWTVNYSTGTGFSYPGQNLSIVGYPDHYDDNYMQEILDFNGDGKDDILETYYNSLTHKQYLNFYYSNGASFIKKTNLFDNPINDMFFQYGDFNGDKKTDILYLGPIILPAQLIRVNNKDNTQFLSAIGDGFNQITKFEYKPLSDNSVYSKGTSATFPVMDYQGPFYVVSKSQTSTGTGILATTNYLYNGAKVHRQGKGFLGFRYFTSHNSTTGLKTVVKNDFVSSSGLCIFSVKETNSYLGSNLISTVTNNTFHVNNYGNKRFFFYPTQITSTDHIKNITNTTTGVIYDSNGNLTSSTTTYGNNGNSSVDNVYEAYSRLSSTIVTSNRTDVPSSETRKTTYSYTNGNLNTKIEKANTALPVTTKYNPHSVFGVPTKIEISGSGAQTRTNLLEYEGTYRFVTKNTNSLGQSVIKEYEPVYGNIIKETGIDGLVTVNNYDAWGRLVSATIPLGHTISTNYNWSINYPVNGLYAVFTSIPGRPATKVFYDMLGRELRKETDGFNGKIIIKQAYNNKGQFDSKTRPFYEGQAERLTQYFYNSSTGLLESESDNGQTTTYSYYNTSVKITPPDGKYVTQNYDAYGLLSKVSEFGGTSLTYLYNATGQVTCIYNSSATTTYLIQLIYQNGFQRALRDPDAGDILYEYNAFGELKKQTDARGNIFNMDYDQLGRLTKKTGPDGITNYAYISSGNGINQLKSLTAPNGAKQEYMYDKYGRILQFNETIDGHSFVSSYSYDDYSNNTGITYPGGFVISQDFDGHGFLKEVSANNNTGGSNSVWKLNAEATPGLQKDFVFGCGLQALYGYNPSNDLLSSIKYGNLQQFEYELNEVDGNLNYRKDILRNLKESFEYDDFHRLNNIYVNQVLTQNIGYIGNGNIQTKTDVGDYDYTGTQPHAVTKITGNTGTIPTIPQNITYTHFNKAESISEGNDSIVFTYGPDDILKKSVLFYSGTPQKTKYYTANYEQEITSNGQTREIHYISGAYGVIAVMIRQGATDNLYYVLKDHLGSITGLVDVNGNLVEEYSFDAWGKRRNPVDWSNNNLPDPDTYILQRGFTGHEHLDKFGLINMQGRVYDPLLGRMLSPDIFIQNSSSQAFNRYSYCINNPLKYSDPTGNWFGWDDLVAAGAGFGVGYLSYGLSTGNWGWKAVAAGGIGAAVAWVGWNTFGAGTAALTHGAGSAGSFTAGVNAVFGAKGGYFMAQYGTYTLMNSWMHRDQLKAADEKGWGGVATFAGYAASAMLSTSLDPSKISGLDRLRVFSGILLTDNISDNMENGELGLHSLHAGMLGGYNFDDKRYYNIWSKGLSDEQRFDMGFETLFGLTLIKSDLKLKLPHLIKDVNGCEFSMPFKNTKIPISKIGYYSQKGYDTLDSFSLLFTGRSLYENWYKWHNNGF